MKKYSAHYTFVYCIRLYTNTFYSVTHEVYPREMPIPGSYCVPNSVHNNRSFIGKHNKAPARNMWACHMWKTVLVKTDEHMENLRLFFYNQLYAISAYCLIIKKFQTKNSCVFISFTNQFSHAREATTVFFSNKKGFLKRTLLLQTILDDHISSVLWTPWVWIVWWRYL